jgi:hypothetical protein
MDKENQLKLNMLVIRGIVINECIVIERQMDDAISAYFSIDSQRESDLKEFFLSTEFLTFDYKRQILQVIINKRLKSITEDTKELFLLLEEIMPIRNKFAHYETDAPDNLLSRGENGIGLVTYKRKKRDVIWFGEKQIEKLQLDFIKVKQFLFLVYAVCSSQNQPPAES